LLPWTPGPLGFFRSKIPNRLAAAGYFFAKAEKSSKKPFEVGRDLNGIGVCLGQRNGRENG